MPAARKPRKKNRKANRRLMLASAPVEQAAPAVVPHWFWSVALGLFLFVDAALLTQTFFTAFSRATVEHAFWAAEEFWFFGVGAFAWMLWFFGSVGFLGSPRPLRVYIFGHELTHAVWVILMGGRVKHFEVRRDGGHILTDTHNFWIALAPYFYPIYSVAVVVVFGLVSLFYDVGGTTGRFLGTSPLQWFFVALGVTWAFHMSFTCWIIPKGQSDLTYGGRFFSLMLIYLMNLLLLAALLVIAAPEVTWLSFASELLENAWKLWLALRSLAAGGALVADSF